MIFIQTKLARGSWLHWMNSLQPSGHAAVAKPPAVAIAVVAPDGVTWFDAQLAQHHYLKAGRPVGDYLRQCVTVRGQPAALLAWGSACYALKDRDQWLGWTATQRVERVKLIVQNRRFLVLTAKGAAPNLASQSLAAAVGAFDSTLWSGTSSSRP